MTTPADPNASRRAAIVDAALQVFLRYGFKKTSMDDLARAASISRQGLYLHFPTKELLFKAAVQRTMESTRDTFRAGLEGKGALHERLLVAFDAVHGQMIGMPGSENLNELLEAATALMGPVLQQLDEAIIVELARVLHHEGGGRKDAAAAAKELAELLYSASYGWKHRVTSPEVYRAGMRSAIRIALATGTAPAGRKKA